MASAIIHLCIAKELNKHLHMNERLLFLGSIAPDISKHLGESKEISHFLNPANDDDIPQIDKFLEKYRYELNRPFEMGYFIHLLTDKYWFRDYIYQYVDRYTRENNKRKLTASALRNIIYNDYTNLNTVLIDKYELSLDIFSNPMELPNSKITEIPVEKLGLLLEKMSYIIEESHEEKNFIFDTTDIEKFIDDTVKYIIKDLQMLNFKI